MKIPKKNLPPRQDSPENQSLAFNYALKYLSYRNRSTKEVYDYLIRKRFQDETINPALKRLVDMKFLNDEEFAAQWISSRQRYKNKSKLILKMELRQKGVSSSMIDHTLSEAQDDTETAKIAYEKKKKTLGNLPAEEFKKKMGGFLARRGYSWEIISKILNN